MLFVRYVGYETERLTIGPNDAREFAIALMAAVYPLDALLVTGDDFAASVMRNVIAQKIAGQKHLTSYRAGGYTRIPLENERQIVLVSEKVFDSYWDRESGARDVIRSRRETAEFHRQMGITSTVADLSADFVDIQGMRFIGPTHLDALAHYAFTFAGLRNHERTAVYDLYMAPKTTLEAAFMGRVAVLESVYALLEVDVHPPSYVEFDSGVKAWDVVYRQHVAAIGSFWVPVDLRLDGGIHVDPEDAGAVPATLRTISHLSEYKVNSPLPTTPFARDGRVSVNSVSVFKEAVGLEARWGLLS